MIDLITSNLLWIVLGLFVLMHLRGHGCGGHSAHRDHSSNETADRDDPRPMPADTQNIGPN